MNRNSLIAAGVAFFLIFLGVVVLANSNKSQNNNSPAAPNAITTHDAQQKPNQSENTNESAQPQTSQSDSTITYTNEGFNRQSLTVKAGTTVTITNNSSRVLQFNSDPHPEHTDNSELNIGNINPGQSKSLTVSKTGSHGFHNHANDDHTGTLIVE
jgi:plastocyanin